MQAKQTAPSSGFTLLELMVVVVIIGILASIAVPAFSKYVRRSKRSEAMVLLKAMNLGAVTYYQTEFQPISASGSASTHCVVPASGTDYLPVLASSAAETAQKRFADFSTNASFRGLDVTGAGVFWYGYRVTGGSELGQCDVANSSGDHLYEFQAARVYNYPNYELITRRNAAVDSEVISTGGVHIQELSL